MLSYVKLEPLAFDNRAFAGIKSKFEALTRMREQKNPYFAIE